MTDLLMMPAESLTWLPPPLRDAIKGSESFVHKGMRKSVHSIMGDLQKTGVLPPGF